MVAPGQVPLARNPALFLLLTVPREIEDELRMGEESLGSPALLEALLSLDGIMVPTHGGDKR
eukprot:7583742-Prorocentrum_lima.AAC.1